MKYIKILLFCLVLIFLALYYYGIRNYLPDAKTSFPDGLVTTFTSTFLSILIGIYLYEYVQKQNKANEVVRFKKILKAESADIVEVLSRPGGGMKLCLPEGDINVIITYLAPLAYEEAGKSGLFPAQVTENLFHISRKIHFYNLKVQHLLSLMRNGAESNNIFHAAKNLNETKTALLDNCLHIDSQISSC